MKTPETAGCFSTGDRGYGINMYSGLRFYPGDPRPDEFTIEDIAHSLSLQCRYNGLCEYFYSVAQHSVYCYEIAPDEFKREALLHDAVEALSGGDMPRPIKHILKEYAEFEHKLAQVVHPALEIPVEMSPKVREIDNIMLSTEKRFLFSEDATFGELPEPLPWTNLPGWDPEYAEFRFMEAWRKLEGIDNPLYEHWFMRVAHKAEEDMSGWTPGQRDAMRRASEYRSTSVRKTYDEVL